MLGAPGSVRMSQHSVLRLYYSYTTPSADVVHLLYLVLYINCCLWCFSVFCTKHLVLYVNVIFELEYYIQKILLFCTCGVTFTRTVSINYHIVQLIRVSVKPFLHNFRGYGLDLSCLILPFFKHFYVNENFKYKNNLVYWLLADWFIS